VCRFQANPAITMSLMKRAAATKKNIGYALGVYKFFDLPTDTDLFWDVFLEFAIRTRSRDAVRLLLLTSRGRNLFFNYLDLRPSPNQGVPFSNRREKMAWIFQRCHVCFHRSAEYLGFAGCLDSGETVITSHCKLCHEICPVELEAGGRLVVFSYGAERFGVDTFDIARGFRAAAHSRHITVDVRCVARQLYRAKSHEDTRMCDVEVLVGDDAVASRLRARATIPSDNARRLANLVKEDGSRSPKALRACLLAVDSSFWARMKLVRDIAHLIKFGNALRAIALKAHRRTPSVTHRRLAVPDCRHKRIAGKRLLTCSQCRERRITRTLHPTDAT